MLNLFLIAVICFSKGILADECTDYMELPDAGKRDPSSKHNASLTALCDKDLVPGWYGTGNSNMPTDFVLPNHCGTVFPFYLKGSNPPNDGQVHNMEACTGDAHEHCYHSVDIQVRNCTNYCVYNLSPFTFCSAAYCFETARDLAPSFQPDSAEVKYKEIVWETQGSKSIPRLVFECDFPLSNDTGYAYGVTWKVHGTLIKSTVAEPSDIETTYLNEKELIVNGYRHGITLTCEADARFADNTNISGPSTASKPFFAGMKVKTPFLELAMSENIYENSIKFAPTVPFACGNSDEKCELQIQMENPNSDNCGGTEIVTDSDKCRTLIQGRTSENADDYYTTGAWEKDYHFNVKASNPENYDLTSEFKVHLITYDVDHQFWSNSSLEEITVNVYNQSNIWMDKSCYLYIDPHVRTFDGSGYRFDGSDMDTVLVYKNGQQEVQVSLYTCSWFRSSAYCICSIAVRAGKDVFIINLCRGQTLIDYVLCEDSVLRVESDSSLDYKSKGICKDCKGFITGSTARIPRVVRCVMCIVPQCENALHQFMDDDTLK